MTTLRNTNHNRHRHLLYSFVVSVALTVVALAVVVVPSPASLTIAAVQVLPVLLGPRNSNDKRIKYMNKYYHDFTEESYERAAEIISYLIGSY